MIYYSPVQTIAGVASLRMVSRETIPVFTANSQHEHVDGLQLRKVQGWEINSEVMDSPLANASSKQKSLYRDALDCTELTGGTVA